MIRSLKNFRTMSVIKGGGTLGSDVPLHPTGVFVIFLSWIMHAGDKSLKSEKVNLSNMGEKRAKQYHECC